MGPLIASDIILLVFTIYNGIFFKHFYTPYPDMKVGFHVWEVCFSKKSWEYGNKLAGNTSIILGLIFFGLIYPLLIYFRLNRRYLVILLTLMVIVYVLLLIAIVKIRTRKKFNLNNK